jgi:hypothetical protein
LHVCGHKADEKQRLCNLYLIVWLKTWAAVTHWGQNGHDMALNEYLVVSWNLSENINIGLNVAKNHT